MHTQTQLPTKDDSQNRDDAREALRLVKLLATNIYDKNVFASLKDQLNKVKDIELHEIIADLMLAIRPKLLSKNIHPRID